MTKICCFEKKYLLWMYCKTCRR